MRNVKVLGVMAAVVFIALVASYVLYSEDNSCDEFIILHTNDTHCYYGDDTNLGLTTVKSLKDSLQSEGNTVFLVDAGDFLQGNRYGSLTEGEASVTLMNAIGYDVGIPGNHEFDYGFDILLERTGELNYPIICSNMIYGSTGESVFPEYLILEKNDVTVGFFGLLAVNTPTTTNPDNMGDAVLTDPIAAAERMVALLEKKDVDCIVALTHLGVNKVDEPITSDIVCNSVEGIDIAIDAHSHTEMEDGKVCDGSIELLPSDTIIASTGCNLANVGKITVSSDDISAKLYRGPAMHDKEFDALLKSIVDVIDEKLTEVVCTTEIYLDGERDHVRSQETNLADISTDALRALGNTDFAILNGGGIRASLNIGDVTLGNVYDVNPFYNDVVTMNVLGSDIYEALELSYSLGTPNGGLLQISGMTVTYDLSKEAGSRIVSIEKDGEPVQKDLLYTVATIGFIANGGNGYSMFTKYETQVVGNQTDNFADYLRGLDTITEKTIEGNRQISV